jgi:hypothetical protein
MANNEITNQNFPLSFNSYAAFDATTLKGLMQQRLIDGGVFTDQIFEGSNFNSLLDVIAYSYHVLLFYLNRTANEASFSNAQLYENVNRIVKILNYNPIGIQTSILSFSAAASDQLPVGIYTIPKYSYFTINDISYSFTDDFTFTKETSGYEVLHDLNNSALLYQGSYVEYPTYVATGEPFEELTMVSVDEEGNNDLIDHNNIDVYVKPSDGGWRKYKRVDSLYLENSISESFELRLNENQRYALKFGNGVTGKKLEKGDLIYIFYLKSDGVNGEIGPNSIDSSRMFLYTSEAYSEIMGSTRLSDINVLNIDQSAQLFFANSVPSSKFQYQETSNEIKENAKNTYKTQYRLITSKDFENYISKNYSNLIQDIKCVDNNRYVNEHLQYLNSMGLSEPNLDSRILFNQVNFGTSCNFNNVYIYCVPKIPQNNNNYNKFLSLGLKNKIKESLSTLKIITSEIVFQDPVYVSVGLGLATLEEINEKRLYPEIVNETKLKVKKTPNSFVNNSSITENILNIFSNYFEDKKLGKTIDIDFINTSLLRINGIEGIKTERNINEQTISSNGISFITYNPIYFDNNEDISILNQTVTLPFFKSAYYHDLNVLKNNIIIE